jgi:GxxExxY protein
MTENELTQLVIGEAIYIHRKLGPGLLEKVYAQCLCHRLLKLGLRVVREKAIPVTLDEVRMDCGYVADLVVENKLVIEVKSIEELAPVHVAQLLTYLKFSNCKLGLLINFNVVLLKHGIRRVVNNL